MNENLVFFFAFGGGFLCGSLSIYQKIFDIRCIQPKFILDSLEDVCVVLVFVLSYPVLFLCAGLGWSDKD